MSLSVGMYLYLQDFVTMIQCLNIFLFYFIFKTIGVPTLAYGIACWMLVRYHEDVKTTKGTVRIYFLNKEEKNSQY